MFVAPHPDNLWGAVTRPALWPCLTLAFPVHHCYAAADIRLIRQDYCIPQQNMSLGQQLL